MDNLVTHDTSKLPVDVGLLDAFYFSNLALSAVSGWQRGRWYCETRQRGARLNRSQRVEHPSAQEKNRTCSTISELNLVCHDSTAALTIACSFCVQSAILSALIRSPYTRVDNSSSSNSNRNENEDDNFGGVAIGNGSRGNILGRLLRSVHRGATCWLCTGAVRT